MFSYLMITFSPLFVSLIQKVLYINHSRSPGSEGQRYRQKVGYLIFAGVIIALSIGLRSQFVGSTDGQIYYSHWEKLSAISVAEVFELLFHSNFEPGYNIAVWVLSQFFTSGQWVFVFQGVIVAVSVCCFVNKNSRHPCVSLIIFMSLGLFNFMVQGIRQSIAMSICFFAVEQIKNRKLIRFLLLVFLAMSFHGSAIVFFPVYFIYGIKVNIKTIVLYTVGLIGVSSLVPYLFNFLNFLLNSSYSITGGEDVSGGSITVLIYASIVLCGFVFNKKAMSKNYYLFLVLSITILVVFLMRVFVASIVARVSMYYLCAHLALIPSIIDAQKDRDNKLLFTFVVMLLLIILIFHKSTYTPLTPYTFFWND